LLQLVSKDVVLYSDGGGQVTAAIRPIISIDRVLPFLQGLAVKRPENLETTIQNINGLPGIVNYIDHQPHSIISFSIENNQIKEIFIVLNPNKLKHIRSGSFPRPSGNRFIDE
jgi:RNA polymerase sigma-70 factor (ECF subfamily)